jgi:hypothetical protein
LGFPLPSSIAAISNEGEVTRTPPVTGIIATPVNGEVKAQHVGNGQQILTIYHDGGRCRCPFPNIEGAKSADLNWPFSTGAATKASGVTLAKWERRKIPFPSWASASKVSSSVIGNVVMTLNLHDFHVLRSA